MGSCSETRNASDSNGTGQSPQARVSLFDLWSPGKHQESQREIRLVSTSHSPRVSLGAGKDACKVTQSPGTQGKLSWVPL